MNFYFYVFHFLYSPYIFTKYVKIFLLYDSIAQNTKIATIRERRQLVYDNRIHRRIFRGTIIRYETLWNRWSPTYAHWEEKRSSLATLQSLNCNHFQTFSECEIHYYIRGGFRRSSGFLQVTTAKLRQSQSIE